MANYSQFRPRPRVACRGFTLLELLIAISITGLILVLAYSGIRLSISSWQKTSHTINNEEDLHLVYGFLRRQLAHIELPVRISASTTYQKFTGSARHMSFVAPLPGKHSSSSGLQRFNLFISESQQGLQLQVNFFPEQNNVDMPSDIEDFAPRVLAEGLESGRFSYFGALPPARSAAWHQTWSTPDALPQLVKVELSLSNQAVNWPAMVIPIYTGSAIP